MLDQFKAGLPQNFNINIDDDDDDDTEPSEWVVEQILEQRNVNNGKVSNMAPPSN